MTNLPEFLEPELNLNGNWDEICEMLYTIFYNDFIAAEPLRCGIFSVLVNKRKGDRNKEIIFWHLITKQDECSNRIPDFARAKRIHWNKPTINNYGHPIVKKFDHLEGNRKIRRYLWLEDQRFCIILQLNRKKACCYLITAFYVEGGYYHSLNRKYKNRLQ